MKKWLWIIGGLIAVAVVAGFILFFFAKKYIVIATDCRVAGH